MQRPLPDAPHTFLHVTGALWLLRAYLSSFWQYVQYDCTENILDLSYVEVTEVDWILESGVESSGPVVERTGSLLDVWWSLGPWCRYWPCFRSLPCTLKTNMSGLTTSEATSWSGLGTTELWNLWVQSKDDLSGMCLDIVLCYIPKLSEGFRLPFLQTHGHLFKTSAQALLLNN